MMRRWAWVVGALSLLSLLACKAEPKASQGSLFRATPLVAFPRRELIETHLAKQFTPAKPTPEAVLSEEERRAWAALRSAAGQPVPALADFERSDGLAWSTRVSGVQVVAFSSYQRLPTGNEEQLWLVLPAADGRVTTLELLAQTVEDGEDDWWRDVVSVDGDRFLISRQMTWRHRVRFDVDAELERQLAAKTTRADELTNELSRSLRVRPGAFEVSPWRYARNDGDYIDRKTGECLALDANGLWYLKKQKNQEGWIRLLVGDAERTRLQFQARFPKSPDAVYGFTFDEARAALTVRNPDGSEQYFERF